MSILESLNKTRFTSFHQTWEDTSGQDWAEMIKTHRGTDMEFLRRVLVQLQFPIQKGMSQEKVYIDATRRGKPVAKEWLSHREPVGNITFYLQSTPVGRVPIIEAEAEEDFLWFLQALAYKNEPKDIPASMGAVMLSGYNNWGRIWLEKKRYLSRDPTGDWNEYFTKLQKCPRSYQDTLLLLSHRPYSGVPAQMFSLSDQEWLAVSLVIRREHELTHYMTRKMYGSAQNNIHDEIIADFMGITAAFGTYRPEYFLSFMGLENYPAYRLGGRLENYLSRSLLSDTEFMQLCTIIYEAAFAIDIHYKQMDGRREDMFHQLCRTPVSQMARGRFQEN